MESFTGFHCHQQIKSHPSGSPRIQSADQGGVIGPQRLGSEQESAPASVTSACRPSSPGSGW